MAMLEMLSEVIGSKEFLGLVALTEFVYVGKVVYPAIPVGLRLVWELFTTIAAGVGEGAMWAPEKKLTMTG